MKTKILAAGLAAFSLALSGCGNITPPVQNGQNSTAITENSSVTDSENSSENERKANEKKSAENAFAAEFFDADINFTDVEDLTAEPMKNSGFESEKNVTNGVQKFTLKSKNGGGELDVMRIDLTNANLSYTAGKILENFGDYYFNFMLTSMQGVTEADVVSNTRNLSTLTDKGKFQRYITVQKTDGMAAQFGYAQTYAVLCENKLTVVSGAFLSADMMERQQFNSLVQRVTEKVQY